MRIIKNTNRLNVVTGQKAFFQLQGLTTSHKERLPDFFNLKKLVLKRFLGQLQSREIGGKRVIYVISMR